MLCVFDCDLVECFIMKVYLYLDLGIEINFCFCYECKLLKKNCG